MYSPTRFFFGHLPEDPQWVLVESFDVVSCLRRIAGNAGVSLAVDLDEIRAYLSEEAVHHLPCQRSSGICDVFGRVQVEVHAEETLGPAQFGGCLRL